MSLCFQHWNSNSSNVRAPYFFLRLMRIVDYNKNPTSNLGSKQALVFSFFNLIYFYMQFKLIFRDSKPLNAVGREQHSSIHRHWSWDHKVMRWGLARQMGQDHSKRAGKYDDSLMCCFHGHTVLCRRSCRATSRHKSLQHNHGLVSFLSQFVCVMKGLFTLLYFGEDNSIFQLPRGIQILYRWKLIYFSFFR